MHKNLDHGVILQLACYIKSKQMEGRGVAELDAYTL